MTIKTGSLIIVSFLLFLSCSKNSSEPVLPNIPQQVLVSKWYRTDLSTAGNFCDIQMINKVLAYAGDQIGQIWRTTDSGKNWIKKFTINPIETINSIHFISASKGYAITPNFIYKTTDSGNSFQQLKIISNGYDIFFTDELNGYYSSSTTIFKTVDGGITWSFSKAADYARLFFKNGNDGWYNDAKARLFYTANAGVLWTQLIASTTGTSSPFYYGLHAWDAQHVATGKVNGLKITQTGAAPFSNITDTAFNGAATAVQFVAPNKGFMITNKTFVSRFSLPDTLVSGEILLGAPGLNEMSFIDSTVGMICGNNGVILSYR